MKKFEKGLVCFFGDSEYPVDFDKAFVYFREAAELGCDKACAYVGLCYKLGRGVSENSSKAVKWFKRGRESDPFALLNLGFCYLDGFGVTKDAQQAMKYFKYAAEDSEPEAMAALGDMFERGRDIKPDQKRAISWYMKAAELGSPFAMYSLGYSFERGHGQAVNVYKALSWYERAHKAGYICNRDAQRVYEGMSVSQLNEYEAIESPGNKTLFHRLRKQKNHRGRGNGEVVISKSDQTRPGKEQAVKADVVVPIVPAAFPETAASTPGRRLAVLIGINYFGQRGQLNGCINDVQRIKDVLISRGWRNTPSEMVILTDDQPARMPTRANLLAAFCWIAKTAMPGDICFVHFSGHGGQTKDLDGDEADGLDETIVPVDWKTSGSITDDVLFDILVAGLRRNVRLVALFDSCHSGTALDLPYIYSEGHLVKDSNKLVDVDVVMFSGCRDDQCSVDTNIQNFGRTGAVSYAFVQLTQTFESFTYNQAMSMMRTTLHEYEQVPQFSCSKIINLNEVFII